MSRNAFLRNYLRRSSAALFDLLLITKSLIFIFMSRVVVMRSRLFVISLLETFQAYSFDDEGASVVYSAFDRRYENDDSITMRKIVAFHNKTSFLRWRLPEHYFYCCLLSDLVFVSKLFKLDSLYAHWINFEGSIACGNNKKLVYFINLSLRGILNEDNFCVVEIHECEKIRSSSNMQHTTNPENLEIHEARESSAKT